jgi:hypothetical protein
VAVAAVLLLVVNDHLLKGAGVPGILTGKLSDVAGVVFLPLLLAASWEWGRHLLRRAVPATISWQPCVATAAAFAAIQLSSGAAMLYGRTLGLLRWVPTVAWAAMSGRPTPPVVVVSCVPDLSDPLVLPFCLLPAWVLRRGAARSVTDLSDGPHPETFGSSVSSCGTSVSPNAASVSHSSDRAAAPLPPPRDRGDDRGSDTARGDVQPWNTG